MRTNLKESAPAIFKMAKEGKSAKVIAKSLGLTPKQVSNAKTLYKSQYGETKVASPQKRAWATRKANQKNAVAINKPRLIDLNGLQIEIHSSMVNRVIVSDKNRIKIF